jgi:hypothetical protein
VQDVGSADADLVVVAEADLDTRQPEPDRARPPVAVVRFDVFMNVSVMP